MLEIRLEDLVIEALVALNQNYEVRSVKLDELNVYRLSLLALAARNGQVLETKLDPVELASFGKKYKDYFYVIKNCAKLEFCLKDGISIGDVLRKKEQDQKEIQKLLYDQETVASLMNVIPDKKQKAFSLGEHPGSK